MMQSTWCSTPSALRAHSWHPVPLLLKSPFTRPSGATEFGERSCAGGELSIFSTAHLMSFALANAGIDLTAIDWSNALSSRVTMGVAAGLVADVPAAECDERHRPRSRRQRLDRQPAWPVAPA